MCLILASNGGVIVAGRYRLNHVAALKEFWVEEGLPLTASIMFVEIPATYDEVEDKLVVKPNNRPQEVELMVQVFDEDGDPHEYPPLNGRKLKLGYHAFLLPLRIYPSNIGLACKRWVAPIVFNRDDIQMVGDQHHIVVKQFEVLSPNKHEWLYRKAFTTAFYDSKETQDEIAKVVDELTQRSKEFWKLITAYYKAKSIAI